MVNSSTFLPDSPKSNSNNVIDFDPTITTPRNLELLNKELYRFSIKLSGLSRTISLKWELLNLDDESLKHLKTAKQKLSGIPLFAPLKEYASKIESKRRNLENKTIFCEGERVVTATVYPSVLAEANELINLSHSYREELRGEYSKGLEDFRARIRQILQAPIFKLSESEIEAKVDIMAGSFISYEEINSFLQVKIIKSRIPSLAEQVQSQTEDAQRFAALKVAQDLEAAAIAGYEQASQSERDDLQQLRTKIYDDTHSEAKDILLSLIEDADTFEIDRPNGLIKKRVARNLERFKVLVEFDTNGSLTKSLAILEKTHSLFQAHNHRQEDDEFEPKIVEIINEIKQAIALMNKANSPSKTRRPVLSL